MPDLMTADIRVDITRCAAGPGACKGCGSIRVTHMPTGLTAEPCVEPGDSFVVARQVCLEALKEKVEGNA